MPKGNLGVFLIAGVIILVVYLLEGDSPEEEFNKHADFLDDILVDLEAVDEAAEYYIYLIYEEEPLEALEVFETSYLPKIDEIVAKFDELDYDYEPLNELLAHQRNSFYEQRQSHFLLFKNLQYIKEEIENDNHHALDPPYTSVEFIYHLDQSRKEEQIHEEKLIDLIEKEFETKGEELPEVNSVQLLTEEQKEELHKGFEEVMELFTLSLTEQLRKAEQSEKENEAFEQKDEPKQLSEQDVTLEDRGSPHVLIEAQAKIDGGLIIEGKTNLIEGSTINISSRVFGLGNPYIEGEAKVDEGGKFYQEIQMIEEEFTEEPIIVTLNYRPEEDMYDVLGEAGEYMQGPLRQTRQDITYHRPRTHAVVRAELMLKEGDHATFEPIPHDPPEDQDELDIWIEPAFVKIHENYYEIELKTNLLPLTDIDLDIEIPDHRVAGYKSYGKTEEDGSVRYHVKRLEDRELEKDEDVIFVVTAGSEGSILSIERYGLHGENFEGDLVEKKKKGKKIVYRFKLDDYKS